MNKLLSSKLLLRTLLELCDLETRKNCSYVNKIICANYKEIIPDINDLKSLLEHKISDTEDAEIKVNNNILKSSYMSKKFYLKSGDGGEHLLGLQKCKNHLILFEKSSLNSDEHTEYTYEDGKIYSKYIDENENITIITIKCDLINWLNNIPILINNGDKRIYGPGWNWEEVINESDSQRGYDSPLKFIED